MSYFPINDSLKSGRPNNSLGFFFLIEKMYYTKNKVGNNIKALHYIWPKMKRKEILSHNDY